MAGLNPAIQELHEKTHSLLVRQRLYPQKRSFNLNDIQALWLPTDDAFPDEVRAVQILKVENSRVISPVGHRWDAFFATGPHVSGDFDSDDQSPSDTDREPL